jgi:hypothetical protein
MEKDRRFRFGARVLLTAGALVGLALLPVAAAGAASSDVPAAEAGTIQQGDVPSNFTESTPMSSQKGVPQGSTTSASGGLSTEVKKISECKGYVTTFQPKGKSVTASADGASLSDAQAADSSQLGSSTLIFKSTGDAKKFFTPIKNAKLATCLDKAMKASITKSLSAGGKASGLFSKFESSIQQHAVPKLGDETVGYQIKFDIGSPKSSGANVTLTMYFDMEFVRTGRGIGSYMSMSLGTPDDTVSQAAIKDAVTRMSTALG